MKIIIRICISAVILLLIGTLLVTFQPKGCSPFVGVGVVVLGFVAALCAWIYWHFTKYD